MFEAGSLMVLKAFVLFEDAIAHYLISREHDAVFRAQLVQYDGVKDASPPYSLILIKSGCCWLGNSEHYELIRNLGAVIDEKKGAREVTDKQGT